jgi:hypothetical protein
MKKSSQPASSLRLTVERFVADRRLRGAEEVLAAVALDLAESFENAPPYARTRLAAELRELVAELDGAELNEADSRSASRHRMSDDVDVHVEAALAALGAAPMRELLRAEHRLSARGGT